VLAPWKDKKKEEWRKEGREGKEEGTGSRFMSAILPTESSNPRKEGIKEGGMSRKEGRKEGRKEKRKKEREEK
jgi:hypothetical protein